MKTISFQKISETISKILSVNTLDAYYCNKHKYFEKGKLLEDKLFIDLFSKLKICYNTSIISEYILTDICLGSIERSYWNSLSKKTIRHQNDEEKKKIESFNQRKESFNKLKSKQYETFEELFADIKKIKGIDKNAIPNRPEGNEWEKKLFKDLCNLNFEKLKQENNKDIYSYSIHISRSRYYDDLKRTFSFLEENNDKNQLEYISFQETNIFQNSFLRNINIPFERFNKSFKKGLSLKISNALINEYKYDFVKNNIDDLVPIIFSLKNCFKKENLIKTEAGIYFLNIGNGILAKIYTRENLDNLNDDFKVLWGDKRSIIFSGYSNSGYLLDKGAYLITSDLIFEIYFDASPFLISTPINQALAQNISDGNLDADEEKKRLEELDDY